MSWNLLCGFYTTSIQMLIEGHLLQPIAWIGLYMTDMLEYFLVILFLCLIWLAVINIQDLIGEIKNPSPPTYGTTQSRLIKWQRSYQLTSDYVRAIEEFFDTFLLIFFAHQFFTFFLFFNDVITGDTINRFEALHYLSKNMFFILMIIFAAQNLEKKVTQHNMATLSEYYLFIIFVLL